MIRQCVICGKDFQTPPSAKKSTCSPACRSERARRHASNARPWSEDAKATLATKGQTTNLKRGTPAAKQSPIAGPFVTNQEAKVWQVIAPKGQSITVQNLRRYLINRLGEAEGERVEAILFRMASVMRNGGDAWVTRCGWTLTAPPQMPDQASQATTRKAIAQPVGPL